MGEHIRIAHAAEVIVGIDPAIGIITIHQMFSHDEVGGACHAFFESAGADRQYGKISNIQASQLFELLNFFPYLQHLEPPSCSDQS